MLRDRCALTRSTLVPDSLVEAPPLEVGASLEVPLNMT